MSDEASTPRRRLRDHRLARRRAQQGHRRACRRRRHLRHARRPPGHLVQDVRPAGNLYDGVDYWTGSGNDTVFIDGTQNRPPGQRTTTILDTGLGNDASPSTLDAASDGFFVLETSGGSATGDPIAHALPAVQDNDNVNASGSSLQLVIIGGFGNDMIRGGPDNDIVLGDLGIVQYVQPGAPDTLARAIRLRRPRRRDRRARNTLGSPILDPRWVYTYVPDMTVGGDDTIYGNGGEDVLVGGAAGDRIDGGTSDDLIFGDAVRLYRRDVTPGPVNAAHDLESALPGADRHADLRVTGDAERRAAREQQRRLAELPRPGRRLRARLGRVPDHEPLPLTARGQPGDRSFGNDYIAGGARTTRSSASSATTRSRATARSTTRARSAAPAVGCLACEHAPRDYSTRRHLPVDTTAAGDGSDYIEGNGGNDSSSATRARTTSSAAAPTSSALDDRRQAHAAATARDLVFGGSGTATPAHDDGGDTSTNGHAHDADAIVGDNGDIVRLVGRTAPDAASFLSFNYDNYSARGRSSPRAIALLDYTPAAPTSTRPQRRDRHRRRSTCIHGESGRRLHLRHGRQRRRSTATAQNDTIVGGYGTDWISGGTGDDGILGDDGRIFVSRNGTAEPLVRRPGRRRAQNTEIIDAGRPCRRRVIELRTALLQYTADLTPDNLDHSTWHATSPNTLFVPLYANDIIYGGLGNDCDPRRRRRRRDLRRRSAPSSSYTNSYDLDAARPA